MKFQNREKVSYRSNKLEKTYRENNKIQVKVWKSNYREIYFYFFIYLKKNFFIFEKFEKVVADSERQYPTSYSRVSTYMSYLIKWRAGGAPSPPGFQVS